MSGAATSIIYVATKVSSRQTRVLSQQKYACRDKTFVVTDTYFCRDTTFVSPNNFVATILLSWQKDVFCREKHVCQTDMLHVVTHKLWSHLLRGWVSIIGGSCHKYNFCRDKTRLLSRQKYACRDNITGGNCYNNHFFARQTRVCRDKITFVTKYFCRDKTVFWSNQRIIGGICHKYICRNKRMFVATKVFCHDKITFQVSRQKLYRSRWYKSMLVTW